MDVEETAAVASPGVDYEKNEGNFASQQPAEKPEYIYDKGLGPWMQVLGSWFLFFNSWYVLTQLTGCSSALCSNLNATGASLTHGALSRHTTNRTYSRTCRRRISLGSDRCSRFFSCFSVSLRARSSMLDISGG